MTKIAIHGFVQTPEEFATFFGHVALKCNVTKAESNFIIRPTDPDFERIIQEIEQFGVKKVAVLLEPLSALRYGSKKAENIDEEGEVVPDEEAEDDEVKSL